MLLPFHFDRLNLASAHISVSLAKLRKAMIRAKQETYIDEVLKCARYDLRTDYLNSKPKMDSLECLSNLIN